MKLSVIIPVYNEASSLEELLGKVKYACLVCGVTKEIIVVDDGSRDSTPAILKKLCTEPDIKLFVHSSNRGKAAAVQTGLRNSRGDIVLIQDADLEYDPVNYSVLLKPILEHKASVVYGSRFAGKIKGMKVINRLANIISNITLNLLFGTRITDVNTGFKVFTREALSKIHITSSNFMLETELTAKLLNLGFTIYEVPIRYFARSRTQGKKITWLEALQMYWGIIKYRFAHNGT